MAARRKKTTKATPKSSALAPIGSGQGLPQEFRDRFRQFRERQSGSTPATVGMPTIRAGNGLFTSPGANVSEERLQAVCLVALRRNSYWPGRYVPGQDGEPPSCGAIAAWGAHENTMAPDPGFPAVQHAQCTGCPRNVAPQKDCRNGLDLALLPTDCLESEAKVREAGIARLRLSSTAIKPWGDVVKLLDEAGAPVFAGILEFRQEQPEGASYWRTLAAPVDWVPVNVLDALGARAEEAAKALVDAAAPVPQVDPGGDAPSSAPVKAPPRRRKKKTAGKRKL